MTSLATKIRKGNAIEESGVNAATVLLHEVKGVAKVMPNAAPSAPVSMALQCVLLAAARAGASPDALLNAITDATGWALANLVGPPGQQRWEVFAAMSADMLARADHHSRATTIANVEPAGEA